MASQCHAYDFIGAVKSLFKAREVEWSWDEYERCIRERSDDALPRRQSVLVLVGSKVELPCPGICFPPESEAQSPWHRVDPLSKSSIAPVALGKGDTRRQLMGYGALVVTDALPSDTGFYRCMWAGREYATYHLQVVAREPYSMVWENEHNSTEERADVTGLPLVTWLEWSEWSSCDRCGSVGRRRRAGICTVGYKGTNGTLPKEAAIMTLLLSLFPEGLPCRSALIPKVISSVLKDHWSVHMIGLCSEPCVQGKGIVVVTDSSGLVEEVVDNSRGIFSLRQKILELPKRARRRTVSRVRGSEVLLSCSRRRFNSKFYQWRNGSVLLNPMVVSQLSDGRVKIDLANNLHILRAEFWDTGIYNCYDGSSLVATVRLVITRPSVMARLHVYASYVNVAALSGVIVLVAISVIRGSNS
ncbi:Ig-like V-type domain-containing protein FAM187A [Rhipicephalus sanguineus]|uniref:Ig-like V-type domain-containing protein FAM187A n=1 Tax=Rhipicephalus sanguineus TaxID=34632 RepID=UPI0020C4CF02|nr:Ig-like V-type domain-containing protein FAM187A [Rhipicephalus sanguineus]